MVSTAPPTHLSDRKAKDVLESTSIAPSAPLDRDPECLLALSQLLSIAQEEILLLALT